MNYRQLQYAIALSETRNFSQVADKLKISQPALSKQILSLENDLGVKLFDRSTVPLTVTPAGEHLIREAKELLYREDQLVRSMERFRTGDAGRLVIGATPFRSFYLMPRIVKEFREAYPNMQVSLEEVGIDILRKEAAEGRYDFALVNLPVEETVFDVIPLESDRLVLAVPTQWVHQMDLSSEPGDISLKCCKALPFVVVHENQEMRRLFEKMCAANQFFPNIAAEVVGLSTAWAMTCAGVAATILPMQFIANMQPVNGVRIFGIQNTAYTRQTAIITRKGQYISAAARYAMELLIKHCKDSDHITL